MSLIICDNCYELIRNFDENDFEYTEYEEEDTIGVIECPNCKTKLSVYYTTSIDYSTREADEEDLKYFN